jgi:hypothetical protein
MNNGAAYDSRNTGGADLLVCQTVSTMSPRHNLHYDARTAFRFAEPIFCRHQRLPSDTGGTAQRRESCLLLLKSETQMDADAPRAIVGAEVNCVRNSPQNRWHKRHSKVAGKNAADRE